MGPALQRKILPFVGQGPCALPGVRWLWSGGVRTPRPTHLLGPVQRADRGVRPYAIARVAVQIRVGGVEPRPYG